VNIRSLKNNLLSRGGAKNISWGGNQLKKKKWGQLSVHIAKECKKMNKTQKSTEKNTLPPTRTGCGVDPDVKEATKIRVS